MLGFSLSGRRKARIRQLIELYLMLAPFLILFFLFLIYPMGRSFYLSLTNYTAISSFRLSEKSLVKLRKDGVPEEFIEAITPLVGKKYKNESKLLSAIRRSIGKEETKQYQALFSKYSRLPPDYVGLENYKELLTKDIRFRRALRNMAVYVPSVVVLNVFFGLSLAMVFRGEGVGKQIMRVVFFMPSVTSSIALFALWRWVFTGETYGLANTLRSWIGLEPITFLANPDWTMRILILMATWGGMGYSMLLFLAGLNAIPTNLYEAAAIDGANEWGSFLHITLPGLRPVLLYVVITGMIGAFQTFEAVYIVFRSVQSIGGVLDSGLMIVPYLYDRGFNRFKLGYASSIAWVLFFIIFVVTLINLSIGRQRTEK
jgi:multiple sugar transport system permease protein